MKLILMMLSISLAFAQERNDLMSIEKTVNDYLIGGTMNDVDRVLNAFDKNATMKFIRDGKLVEVNAPDFFKKGMKPGPKQDRKTTVVSISYDGNAGQAKLHIDYKDFRFVDYMSLLKINGEWKIVGKIFFKEMKN